MYDTPTREEQIAGQKIIPVEAEVSGVCGSGKDRYRWLTLWEKVCKRQAGTCSALRCSKPAELGAHVWLRGDRRSNFCYIIPTCDHHNNRDFDYGNTGVNKAGETKGWFRTKANTAFMEITAHDDYFE